MVGVLLTLVWWQRQPAAAGELAAAQGTPLFVPMIVGRGAATVSALSTPTPTKPHPVSATPTRTAASPLTTTPTRDDQHRRRPPGLRRD
jgi:hypothetical protein